MGLFVPLDYGRVGLWVIALAGGALAFGAMGVAIGALAREVRAASLLAFLLALPIAFLALVPAGSVASGLYDVIRFVSALFPFRPALEAVDEARQRRRARPRALAGASRGARRRLPGDRARRPGALRVTARVRLDDAPTAIRPTDPADGRTQLALRIANRGHTGPWDPTRDESFYTAAGQRLELDLDQRAWTAGSAFAFAVLDTSDGARMIGRVALANIVRGPWQNATLGYWISADAGGRGHATRAVRLILRFAFEHAGLHRVQPAVIPRNHRSIRVVERVGFRREGRALRYLRIDGVWEDHDIYALTREDWEGMKVVATMDACPSRRRACAACAARPSCATSCARRASTPATSSCRCSSRRGWRAAGRSTPCPASTATRSRRSSRRPARPCRSASPPCCSSASRPRRTTRARAPGTTRASSSSPSRAIKDAHPDLLVITDVCLCEYTEPRPLRPAARRTVRSTTTRASSCSRAPPSRTRARAPTSSRRAT